MKRLPKKIIRVDDGMEFLLNEGKDTYSIHFGIPHLDDQNHLDFEHTFEELMCFSQNKGKFKIADGTEDIQAMKKKWMDEMDALMRSAHGCGDDEDDGC